MTRTEAGYTLAELVVVMAIFAVVMAITSLSFNRIVSSSAQITRNTDTDIEGMIGLELMRSDLENAGYGLAWSYPAGVAYTEAAHDETVTGSPGTDPALYNDDSVPPRPVLYGDNVGYNDSDYLVVKGSSVGMNRTARKWSYLTYSSVGTKVKPARGENELELGSSERVVVVKESVKSGGLARELQVTPAQKFFAQFKTGASVDALSSSFWPKGRGEKHVVYGVDQDTDLRMPYNRADYFIRRPDAKYLSARCAPGTGILYKAVVEHGNGRLTTRPYPIVECVADLQVIFTIDQGTGPVHLAPGDEAALLGSAEDVRSMVREIRVYVLAHEGGRQPGFSYHPPQGAGLDACPSPADSVRVGEFGLGKCFDFNARHVTDWEHYRWKVYPIVVQPKNFE